MAQAAKKSPIQFTGFTKKAFAFYKGIDFYQSKEWYTANKHIYENEVLTPLSNLITLLDKEMKKIGLPLRGDPKTAIFRIHRDVRFSKNKTPYKTHAGATLSRNGKKLSPGMLYIHIAPDECFLAMGTYHPMPEELKAIRDAMAREPKRWLGIIKGLEKKGLTLSDMEPLKRLPRGFEAFDKNPIANALKQRSLIIYKPISHANAGSKRLITDVLKFAETGRKFLEFNWSAVDKIDRNKE